MKALPKRGERTAKHRAAEEKKMGLKGGGPAIAPKAGIMPPQYGGKMMAKGKKK